MLDDTKHNAIVKDSRMIPVAKGSLSRETRNDSNVKKKTHGSIRNADQVAGVHGQSRPEPSGMGQVRGSSTLITGGLY